VGLGSIFSRLYTSAVVFPPDFQVPDGIIIKDSKQMTENQKQEATVYIKEHALAWTVQWEDEACIDKIGLAQAKHQSWHKCLDHIGVDFDLILADGNTFYEYKKNGKRIRHETVIKGDNTYLQIAAASILAKNSRDEYVRQMAIDYPDLQKIYKISSNVGYPTPEHKAAIKEHGITQFHRKSTKTCKENPTLNIVRKSSGDKDASKTKDDFSDISDICFV
jgi:ribonuclease HII